LDVQSIQDILQEEEMKRKNLLQRGQALILLALGLVGLVGFTALAIDGGRAFADRRHAQNAADNAAYAASFEWARHGGEWIDVGGILFWNDDSWKLGATRITNANGYFDNGVTSEITLEIEPYNDCDTVPPFKPADGAYITVTIRSTIDTMFAPVVGIAQMHNTVHARSTVCRTYTEQAANGAAVAACNPTACPAMKFTGTNITTITGSNVMDNSNCDNPAMGQDALQGSGSATVTLPYPYEFQVVGDEKWDALGGITITTGVAPIDCFSQYIDISKLGVSCKYESPTSHGSFTDGLGVEYYEPGIYKGNFPPNGDSAGKAYLRSGIYCIDGDFSIGSSHWELYTEGDLEPSDPKATGVGVTFVLNGDLKITDGTIKLLGLYHPEPLDGRLLFYAPYGDVSNPDTHTISVAGNGASTFRGTIFAPTSDITLTGVPNAGTGDSSWYGQVIGDTITVAGTVDWRLVYDEDYTISFPIAPNIAMQD